MTINEFADLRFGLFVHFGLYSSIGRGEWVMNREQISPEEMERYARENFRPTNFNADEICDLAVESGMKYIVLTTMHHDGFRLYDTELTDYNASKVCGRDLVAEVVESARRRGLKIGLYHSLNNWHDQPDAVSALENSEAYRKFIDHTFARLRELTLKFAPFDILWYDGWWPFDAKGWQAEKMNREMREFCPGLLFNGRNGLPGDFGTPEGHLTTPTPYRPWEACMTLNEHWGFHPNDHDWKSAATVIKMLMTCAEGKGNLLLNIGPDGSGAIPPESKAILRQVGEFLRDGGAEVLACDEPLKFGPGRRTSNERSDWDGAGVFTAKGDTLYLTMFYPPMDNSYTISGLECEVTRVSCRGKSMDFTQNGGKITFALRPDMRCGEVYRLECAGTPSIYRTGGMRVPSVDHPRYDPVEPDIKY